MRGLLYPQPFSPRTGVGVGIPDRQHGDLRRAVSFYLGAAVLGQGVSESSAEFFPEDETTAF